MKSAEGHAACLSLLQAVGEGYRHLSMYRCHVSSLSPLCFCCMCACIRQCGTLHLRSEACCETRSRILNSSSGNP